MIKKPKVLFYDLESTPLLAYIWQPGEQYVGHSQLHKDRNMWDIICITYCYNDGKPAKHLDFDYDKQDSTEMIKEFDRLAAKADIVIGKNNKRFDDKMINAIRMFKDLPCDPSWMKYTGDLERQMRKYFRLPSQSLDYISHKLGLGGKIKMQISDWIDIIEKNPNGLKAFNKMIKYGKKDITDTRAIWNYLEAHCEPIFNMAALNDQGTAVLRCRHCASPKLHKDGFKTTTSARYQIYKCNDCSRVAGRTTSDNPKKLS